MNALRKRSDGEAREGCRARRFVIRFYKVVLLSAAANGKQPALLRRLGSRPEQSALSFPTSR